jgi:hypothetical protein
LEQCFFIQICCAGERGRLDVGIGFGVGGHPDGAGNRTSQCHFAGRSDLNGIRIGQVSHERSRSFLELTGDGPAGGRLHFPVRVCTRYVADFRPQANCWFFRRSPEARIFALLFAPALVIFWPVMLFGVILKSRGISPDDPDFLDD